MSVKTRLLVWAAAGFCVACAWTLYAFLDAPDTEVPLSLADRVIQTLAVISCPATAIGLTLYWVIPLNAAMYAVLGVVIESLRPKSKPVGSDGPPIIRP